MLDNPEHGEGRIEGHRLLSSPKEGDSGIYRAERLKDSTQVAIKLLDITGLARSEDSAKFLDEAMVLHLQHPHIVPILDSGVDRTNTPFLVMPYAVHGSLRERHERGILLSPEQVARYVSQIASALQYAHDQQIVHGDLKPENVLLNDDEQLMVSDFGIASATGTLATNDHHLTEGTVYYMAPEQVEGTTGPTSDQYALGIVAYEWLSGHTPFEGSSALEIAMQHLTTPPPSLCDAVPSLSPQIEKAIFRALAKDPDARFPSVQACSDALQQATGIQDSQPF